MLHREPGDAYNRLSYSVNGFFPHTQEVPLLAQLLAAGGAAQAAERTWLLRLLAAGLRGPSDGTLYRHGHAPRDNAGLLVQGSQVTQSRWCCASWPLGFSRATSWAADSQGVCWVGCQSHLALLCTLVDKVMCRRPLVTGPV